MSIQYACKYCKQQVGRIDQAVVSEETLGLDTLSAEERKRLIHYQNNGEMLIQVICEHCEDVLERHPELILNQNIHQ